MPEKTPKLDNEQSIALGELEALVKIPGSLKMITAEVAPEHRQDGRDRRSPAKDDADLYDPHTFVLHDVTSIEPSKRKEGYWMARTKEGDWIMGKPQALVKRLREWRGG